MLDKGYFTFNEETLVRIQPARPISGGSLVDKALKISLVACSMKQSILLISLVKDKGYFNSNEPDRITENRHLPKEGVVYR